MSFIWPSMVLSLLLILPLTALYLRLHQRRRRLAAQYGSFGLGPEAAGRPAGWRRHLPAALFLVGLALLLLALARPEAVVSLPRVEGTVILAFDVSGSMAATDLQPTRMEAAKAAARQFVGQQPASVLVGVVAFSESGLAVQAPTNDQEMILATIDRLEPQQGTSLANGIFASLNTLTAKEEPASRLYTNLTPAPTPTPTPVPAGEYTPAVIVLLTDGENNLEPNPVEAARLAAGRGVRIYTVGIGSAAGATLEVNGFTVFTQLDEGMLKQISALTDGTYYNAENEEALQAIYQNIDPELVVKPEKMEVTSIFAGTGLLVLLAGGAFSLLWFGRMP
jgi:Ca-activated chloride channel family protein